MGASGGSGLRSQEARQRTQQNEILTVRCSRRPHSRDPPGSMI